MVLSNYIEISKNAIRHNAKTVCNSIEVPVIGVVKCNGYGATVSEAAAAWHEAGVCMFGVSRPEEALELRGAGYTEDIILLTPISDTNALYKMIDNRIILTVGSLYDAQLYSLYSYAIPIRVHIAVDTGMGRFGINWKDLMQIKTIYNIFGLQVTGIFSHFAKSYEKNYILTKKQLGRFLYVTESLQAAGIKPGLRHIANSSAALRFPETHLDAVRIGSALVRQPSRVSSVSIQPVATFKAQVIACKYFQPGDRCGYGFQYRIKKHTKAAIVSLGSIDGFGQMNEPGHLGVKDLILHTAHTVKRWLYPPYVTFKENSLPLLGQIGNQHTLFDATGTDIAPGDTVQWYGRLMLCGSERVFV